MRILTTVALVVVAIPCTSTVNASALTFLSTEVNPFGVPAVGTGIAIYVDTDGTQAVTAQQWKVQGHIVNNDAPGSIGVLSLQNPPPIVQSQRDTTFANLLDSGISTQWQADDSYWGDYFTAALLGAGYNNSGTANPNGAALTTMELQGGTSFGSNPATHELLLYVVTTSPFVLSGELAIGSSQLEVLDPICVDPLNPFSLADPDHCIPEPAALTLAGLCLGLLITRRRIR